jgi:hypothetical protein
VIKVNEIIKVRLENPIEGYEELAEYRQPHIGEQFVAMGGNVLGAQIECVGARLVLTPKQKRYDWSKTSRECLVYLVTGGLCQLQDADYVVVTGIYEGWQAITDDTCPVDESAVDVEYRAAPEGDIFVTYGSEPRLTQYRVKRLKTGYKY